MGVRFKNKTEVIFHATGSRTMEPLHKGPREQKKMARFKGDEGMKEKYSGDYQLKLQTIKNHCPKIKVVESLGVFFKQSGIVYSVYLLCILCKHPFLEIARQNIYLYVLCQSITLIIMKVTIVFYLKCFSLTVMC